jgi:hypothetical protein
MSYNATHDGPESSKTLAEELFDALDASVQQPRCRLYRPAGRAHNRRTPRPAQYAG